MKVYKSIFLILISSLLALQLSADDNFTKRMKTRLPEIVQAKDKGSIGEGMNGLLLIRSKSNSKIDALVKAENLDRQSLFKHLAKQTGGDVNIVAKKFAKGIAARAKKGHWFKNSSGNWVSK
tara:strand:- start:3305 stop:3670 length:366 start_codon:yes stop_codon:yes gene_type:complete